MEISLHAPGVRLNERTSRSIVNSFSRALKAHAPRLSEVTVTLRDTNAQKGGVDKECKVVARIRRQPTPVVVTEVHEEILGAIRAAAAALSEALRRRLEKKRTTVRRPRPGKG